MKRHRCLFGTIGNELKLTWDEGERTCDAHSRSLFNMKAILMWVIHDFPYGNMAGCMTKGFCACPICQERTHIQSISNIVGSVCTWDIVDIF